MLGNVFHLLYVIHFHLIKHAWSFTNFRISMGDDPHLQHLALTMVTWRTGSYYTKRKIRSFMYLAFMCHKSLSEYQSRHSNIKQEHDSSGGLLHDKAPSLPALGRRNMAGTGERHGRGSSVPSIAGETLWCWSLQHSVSRKNLLGGCNPNLTELSNNTPSYSHRDKIFPSFYCFSILYKPDKRSTLLACRVFCLFVFFFLPKATVNVPDFNVSLYSYIRKTQCKIPQELAQCVSDWEST